MTRKKDETILMLKKSIHEYWARIRELEAENATLRSVPVAGTIEAAAVAFIRAHRTFMQTPTGQDAREADDRDRALAALRFAVESREAAGSVPTATAPPGTQGAASGAGGEL